jgi:hypothetical protein
MADEDRSFDPTRRPSLAPGNRGPEPDDGSEPATQGVSDNPEEDWGEPIEGAAYSANHATRGTKTDAERGPGPKTRKATKDTISRR